jgi:hypothetical protein
MPRRLSDVIKRGEALQSIDNMCANMNKLYFFIWCPFICISNYFDRQPAMFRCADCNKKRRGVFLYVVVFLWRNEFLGPKSKKVRSQIFFFQMGLVGVQKFKLISI